MVVHNLTFVCVLCWFEKKTFVFRDIFMSFHEMDAMGPLISQSVNYAMIRFIYV